MSKRKQATRPLIEAPQTDSEEQIYAISPLPNGTDWKRVFLGGLRVLTAWTNYEPSGTNREAYVASVFKDTVEMTEFTTFCQEMIKCFADPDVLQALADALAGLGIGSSPPNAGIPNEELCSTDLSPEGSCPPEVNYGRAVAIVEELHGNVLDAFEFVEWITDAVELAAMLSDNVGIFSAIPASALEFSEWFINYIQDTYMSSYNDELRDEIACRLYCDVQPECTYTLEGIRSSYASFIDLLNPPEFSLSNANDIVSWFAGLGVVTPEETVYLTHMLCVEVYARLATFFGSSWNSIKTAIANAGISEPMCEDCITYCHKIDFTVTNGGFVLDSGGIWIDGVGWKPTQFTGGMARHNAVVIALNLDPEINVTSIEITYTSEVLQNQTDRQDLVRNLNGSEVSRAEQLAVTHIEPTTLTNNNENTIDRVELAVYAGSKDGTGDFSGGNAGDCTLLQVVFRGNGVNPFGVDNC